MSTLTVGISDLKVAKAPDILVTYALGSCVGICLFDPMAKVAGLSHIMLPDSRLSAKAEHAPKFADTAIPMLIKQMVLQGASQARIKAKIAGGAQMFAALSNSAIANIGHRNVLAVKTILMVNRISIIAEDTGKDYGRTLYLDASDGSMKIKSVNRGEWTW